MVPMTMMLAREGKREAGGRLIGFCFPKPTSPFLTTMNSSSLPSLFRL
jgi:hypothetical protein